MNIAIAIAKIRSCGFQIHAEGDHISVEPFDRLTDGQLGWLKANKPAILDHLRSTATVLEAGQPGNDLPAANDQANPITVQVWTPAGDPVRVRARDQAHADFIRRMNPGPGMVRCADCQHADVRAGIASCRAGVESGLPIQGFWATDRHLCFEFQGKPAKSGSAQNSDPIPEKSTSPEPHRATKSS